MFVAKLFAVPTLLCFTLSATSYNLMFISLMNIHSFMEQLEHVYVFCKKQAHIGMFHLWDKWKFPIRVRLLHYPVSQQG